MLEARFEERIERIPFSTCWYWAGAVSKDGYGKFAWSHRKTERAHRAAYLLYIGPLNPGDLVLHSCDNRLCCNPAHLSKGSHKENMRDMVLRGRQSKGEQHYKCKLTDAQVAAIRVEYALGGTSTTKLGRKYGVAHSTIARIIKGEIRATRP